MAISESFLCDITAREIEGDFEKWLHVNNSFEIKGGKKSQLISNEPFLLHSIFYETLNAALSIECISSAWSILQIYKRNPSENAFRISLERRRKAALKKVREFGLYSRWFHVIMDSNFDEFIDQANDFIKLFERYELPIISGGVVRAVPFDRKLTIQTAQNLSTYVSLERIRRIVRAFTGGSVDFSSSLKSLSNVIHGKEKQGADDAAAFKKQRDRLRISSIPIKSWLLEDYEKITRAYTKGLSGISLPEKKKIESLTVALRKQK